MENTLPDAPKLVRNLSQQHWDCAIEDLKNMQESISERDNDFLQKSGEDTISAGSSRCLLCPCQPNPIPCWNFLVRNDGQFFACETWQHGKLCSKEIYSWKEPKKIVAVKVF